MFDPESRRGRVHDAEGARRAILDAAEAVFAQHGFDGARIDTIAVVAGYNKSLIFQYFGNKLSLYAEVIRRADEQTRRLEMQVLAALLDDGTPINADRLKSIFKTYLNAYFDFLVEHPRLVRILQWEMAEGWQTYAKVLTQRDVEDVDQFVSILSKSQGSGLLRSTFMPMAQLLLVELLVPCYLSMLPLVQALQPGETSSSTPELAGGREFMVEFVVRGMMMDEAETRS